MLSVAHGIHGRALIGFVHTNLNQAPSAEFQPSTATGITGLDYAGNDPETIVRVGNGDAYVVLVTLDMAYSDLY